MIFFFMSLYPAACTESLGDIATYPGSNPGNTTVIVFVVSFAT